MKMRFRKTPMSRRVSYCYESVTGEKFRISAEEYGAETVSLLHRMDDSEVRNNLSTGKPGIQKWQEEAARQWRERHPDEEPPKNWVLSLDSLTGEDGSGMAVRYELDTNRCEGMHLLIWLAHCYLEEGYAYEQRRKNRQDALRGHAGRRREV